MTIEEVMKKDNFLDMLQERGIMARYDGPYVLLKYKNLFESGEMAVDFSEDYIKECRGIILKKVEDGYKIVCRPFKKWFNFQEPHADEIDWTSARVQAKIDGSLVKLWFDEGWHWSTMGTIDADYADTASGLSFGEIIRQSDNFKVIDFDNLDKELTYIFELVSPYNQVVIKYNTPHLYHIGTRRRNGEELNVDIGIEKPTEYPLHSLEECIAAAEKLNDDMVTDEGYVVVDKNWNRIKIKSPKYVLYHRVWNNGAAKAEDILSIINSGEMRKAMKEYPLLREDILKWNAAIALFEYELEADISAARQVYEEYQNRGVAASFIKKFKHPFAGFWGLDHEGHAEDLINSMSEKGYVKGLKGILKEVGESEN